MPKLLRIDDTHGHAFLSMPEVLDALRPEADDLSWSVLDLREAVTRDGSELDPVRMDREARRSPTGLQLSFAELHDFAVKIGQVIDGLFVACATENLLPKPAATDAEIVDQAEMVVAAVDSTLWLVAAPGRVLDRVRETFREVSEVSPGTPPLRS